MIPLNEEKRSNIEIEMESTLLTPKLFKMEEEEEIRSGRRKGFTKIDSAGKEIKYAVVDYYSQGYSINAIINLLLDNFEFQVSGDTVKKFLKRHHEEFGDNMPGTLSFEERTLNEFGNAITGLNHVQQTLRKLFDEAVEDKDIDAIKTYAKLINENVETAHKVLADKKSRKLAQDISERKANSEPSSFGDLVKEAAGKRAIVLKVPQ